MSEKVWLEAALNGPWGKARQPGIPVSIADVVADGLAAAAAGAAIIHVHAYDETTGRQNDDWQVYARIIEGIRARCDAIVYPTIPLAGGPDAREPMPAEQRFAAVRELAARGLIEWTVVDPGSASLASLDDLERGLPGGFLYENPEAHIRHGLALCAEYGLTPGYAIYEPGFMRAGAALARSHGAPQPIYRLMMSDGFCFGFPPRAYAVDAYLALLGDCAPGSPWMAAGLDVDIEPIAGDVVARGGHLRAGLEDARFGETRSNLELVASAASAIAAAGREPASAAEIRSALAG